MKKKKIIKKERATYKNECAVDEFAERLAQIFIEQIKYEEDNKTGKRNRAG
jgi:ATP-dependent phosphoenolpyruvate carboxykinase